MGEPVEREVLARYGLEGARLTPLAGGHINHSWVVAPERFLLQRLNPVVFPDGRPVVQNLAAVSRHLQAAVRRLELPDPDRRVLRLVSTGEGEPGVQDGGGAWWRVLHYIPGSRTLHRAETPEVARETGRAFGLFQRMLADYAGPPLAETIPGFHDTRQRLARLEQAVSRDAAGRASGVAEELRVARRRAGYADVLPPLMAGGQLPQRVVHNDAKVGNVLFDRRRGFALAVVDLDTVMPGTLLSDVGDLVRSTAASAAEDERDLSRIMVRPGTVEAVLAGFLGEAGETLTPAERAHLVFAGILLTFEQGVRFLTDYLEGDTYYRIAYPQQNLDRVRAQFRLLEALEGARGDLERRVAGFA